MDTFIRKNVYEVKPGDFILHRHARKEVASMEKEHIGFYLHFVGGGGYWYGGYVQVMARSGSEPTGTRRNPHWANND